MERGYVQVYTGEGKGKSTAAFGLALRASGFGLKVYIGQFMKGQDYSELRSVPNLPGVTLEQYGDPGWVYRDKLKPEQIALAKTGWEKGTAAVFSGAFDIVILDEINMAVWFGLLPLQPLLELVERKPAGVELVLTGRRAAEELIEKADLVTEMREVKHYYTQNVGARRGIEN